MGSSVFKTVREDGSADFTVQHEEDNHKFSAVAEDGYGVVEYEETLTWPGVIRVKEPREEVWRKLAQSDEMTEYLESQDLVATRREKR